MTSPSGPALRTALQVLSPAFYSELPADPVPDPHWIATSPAASTDLGVDALWLQSPEALQLLSGNAAPATAQTRATVYSGHQFGVWAGQLGDGRALLLGEFDSLAGPMELQLKGSGATPYSRGGDGRAVLRSSIREFLVSEAMHALGVPTTRALSLIGSPLRVRRETTETAAVLARTAPSFLRFGHFEHFASAGRVDELRALADYVIQHHYPECRHDAALSNPYAALLQAVSERTASLVAHWQSVGFCHGVLNTDNMSILGLTIDYGPFQFLDAYVPNHVCNHSDQLGRYAFDRQPNVAYWSLYCLGQALQPLIGEPEEVVQALESYKRVFPARLAERFAAKLGLTSRAPGDAALIDGILQLLANEAVDFTQFWRALTLGVVEQLTSAESNQQTDTLSGRHELQNHFEPVRDMFIDRETLDAWLLSYTERLMQLDQALSADLMEKSNPRFVLRNYLAEQAIRMAQAGDYTEIHRLQSVLARPFDDHAGCERYAALPPDWASQLSISCSS